MSKKDYFLKKQKIENNITEIRKKIDETAITDSSSHNYNFILNAATLEFSRKLISEKINMKSLIQDVGRDLIKEFVNILINKIIVKDRQIISLEFKNGLVTTFIYNS